MYEQPRTRRLGPAVIAFLVVLAAAAGAVGYYGARRALGIGQATSSTTTDPGSGKSPQLTPTAAGPSKTQPANPDEAPGDPTTCPKQTRDALAAKGLDADLTVLLYVEARLTGNSPAEVWICRNAGGLLVYQGHVLSGPITDRNVSLLLAEGVRGKVEEIDGGYLATNPNGEAWTEYRVTRDVLIVTDKPSNNERFRYEVVRALP